MSTATIFNTASKPLSEELDQIFREHYPLVYRTAYGVTRNAQDAEDIVQSLFLQLLRLGFPSGLREKPKAYLYRAAINLSLNAVKARRRHMLISDAESIAAALQAPAPDPSAQFQERLVNALTQLNPKASEILILRYTHNYSDADIAKLLGRSRGAIAVSLYRARARLKKLIEHSGEKP